MHQTTPVLLLLCVSGTFGKYVFVQTLVSWHRAQEYCRVNYTDLAPIETTHDLKRLRPLVNGSMPYTWIGLYRDPADHEVWRWSGGGKVSNFFWALGQPDNRAEEDYGVIKSLAWHDSHPSYEDPFFCYRAIVVREKRSWEDALRYCKRYHHDLASLASETEMLLVQKEMGKALTTKRVWTGLRFLAGQWLWVDGEPLEYQAWRQQGTPQCPEVKLKCGALQVTGVSTNNGPQGTQEAMAHLPDSDEETPGVPDAEPGVWEARDCEEQLHFICY